METDGCIIERAEEKFSNMDDSGLFQGRQDFTLSWANWNELCHG